MSLFDFEGIPGPAAKIYSLVIAQSPIMKDFYRGVTKEVSSRMSSGKLLDIGTGPGFIPLDIARISPDLEIKAIDISPAMVSVANKNARDAGLPGRVEFKFGSAQHIPFGDNHFDLIMSTLSFHHWASPEEGFKEIFRTLKPGGEAWIYEIRKDVPKEAKLQIQKSYGWFLTFIILYVVRLHSAVKLQRFQELHTLTELGFSRIEIEERGLTLKLRLLK